MPVRRTVCILIGVLAALAGPSTADAQIWKKLKKTAEDAVERETVRKADEAVTRVVRCVFNDAPCIQRARAEGREVELTDQSGEVVVDEQGQPIAEANAPVGTTGGQSSGAESVERPGTGAWANYEFVPGERILFAEDFTNDTVGDFPRRLELVKGNWEIVDWKGRRLLRHTGPRHSAFRIPLPETLPERFTIELEVHFPHPNHRLAVVTQAPPGPSPRPVLSTLSGNYVQISPAGGTGVSAPHNKGIQAVTQTKGSIDTELTPIRVMADGRYVKVYVNEQRVANVPNAELPRGNALYVENLYSASEKDPMYLGAIRVAAGGRDLYDALEADGRVSTQGIYFATNSDRIRPESTPTLKEIGEMLKAHPGLRLSIEGHTDAAGEDAYNQQLSERRAEAVKAYLVQTYGIDTNRLETAGHGESKPVGDNATAEGRQQNRRVELVKLG